MLDLFCLTFGGALHVFIQYGCLVLMPFSKYLSGREDTAVCELLQKEKQEIARCVK